VGQVRLRAVLVDVAFCPTRRAWRRQHAAARGLPNMGEFVTNQPCSSSDAFEKRAAPLREHDRLADRTGA
jgi:hypothetical protein